MTDTGMNVAQADREAAAEMQRWRNHDRPSMAEDALRDGLLDGNYNVQAFARHREAVITAAMAQDRARIAELEEALGLAADRLHWASVATPGITHQSAKDLLSGWSQEARNVTDA